MIPATECLLRDLRARGICLSRIGDRLHVQTPRGMFTDDLRELLVENKRAILELLAADELRASHRPVLHFRLAGVGNAWATLIGRRGDSVEALRADLFERFGDALAEVHNSNSTRAIAR